MNESNTKILYTEEYGMFHFLKGNRDLNEGKVNRIVNDVKDGMDFFKFNPINVNEQFYIIDGQHRFAASRMLKKPVYFVVVPNVPLQQIARLNNNQSRWKTIDFMNCYIDADVNRDDYQYLSEFVKLWKMNISVAINLLMGGKVGSGGGDNSETFRNGEFKVRFKDLAVNIACKATDYKPFCADYKSRPFLQAIEMLVRSEKYDHDKVIGKLKKINATIEKRSTHKDYLAEIEILYNFKNSIRQVLY
ncbi:MAG: hypothetical protein AB2L20_14775 [Mangrovibacterium sp.]